MNEPPQQTENNYQRNILNAAAVNLATEYYPEEELHCGGGSSSSSSVNNGTLTFPSSCVSAKEPSVREATEGSMGSSGPRSCSSLNRTEACSGYAALQSSANCAGYVEVPCREAAKESLSNAGGRSATSADTSHSRPTNDTCSSELRPPESPGRALAFDALLMDLSRRHPALVKEIAETAANSLRFQFLQECARSGMQGGGEVEGGKARRIELWDALGEEERRDLVEAYGLGEGRRDTFFLKIVEEDRILRRKLGEDK